jgi:formate-dependent nitrite reductase membrane component NrfD
VIAGEPKTSYYGLPILHAPVWTWQIGAYLFIGGAAGMSAVIAFAAVLGGYPIALVRAALSIALAGAVLSPVLLVWDLGRPSRFLNMLRVFKWRSAMSVGVWTLVLFSGFVFAAVLLVDVLQANPGGPSPLGAAAFAAIAGAAVTGAVLATYTGVLLGATAVPVWSMHHRLLPVHFGVVALGSAAALLELIGYAVAPLNGLGLAASAIEIAIGASIELRRHGAAGRALRTGTPGLLLRAAGALTGPFAFVLRLAGLTIPAAACFVAGAILSRYGWLLAGRASTGPSSP